MFGFYMEWMGVFITDRCSRGFTDVGEENRCLNREMF